MSVSPYTQSSAHWPKRAEGEITRRRTHGTNESQEGGEGEGRPLFFFEDRTFPCSGRSVGRSVVPRRRGEKPEEKREERRGRCMARKREREKGKGGGEG